ncbi:MAG TPA: hypothetical protein VMW08_11500 [Acidimicrobiales bacterium]|nr:hypothetical protein [Acidimicrobiales bacterium]
MTDPTIPGWQEGLAGTPPASPQMPLGPPPGSFDSDPTQVFDLASAETVSGPSTKSPGRLAVLGLGAVMLVGGTAFALTSAGSGGPETPEEAAASLFDAIADEDALGVLGSLDPAERDAVREPMQQMVRELERLEVLDESFDLTSVSGFDFEFEGLEFEVESVRSDLARVHVTAGAASVAVDGDEVAVGSFVDDVLDEFGGDMSELTTSDRSELDGDSGGFLVARNTADGWRISLGYTAAEAARDALGGSVPAAGDGIVAHGADSPEAAVDGMLRSAAAADLEDVIARFSSEMRPLREYSSLYAEGMAAAEAEASDAVQIDVRNIDLESTESGSTALVQVRGFDLSVEADGSRFDVLVDGDCITLSGDLADLDLEDTPFESGEVCMSEFRELSREGFDDFRRELEAEGIEIPEFGPFNEVQVGIVAVREDGEWFVSPVRTSMDLGVKALQALNREHLDAGVDFVEALVDSFVSEFETSFDDGFSTTDDTFATFEEVDEVEVDGGVIDDEQAAVPIEDVDPDQVPGTKGGIDDEFDFPDTFDEQIELMFGEDASCILAEVDGLKPELRDQIRGDFTDGALSIEAGEALNQVFDRCGAFSS